MRNVTKFSSTTNVFLDNFPPPENSTKWGIYKEIYNAIKKLQLGAEAVPIVALSNVTSARLSTSTLAGRLVYTAEEPLTYGDWVTINAAGNAVKNVTPANVKNHPLFCVSSSPVNAGDKVIVTSTGVVETTLTTLVPGMYYYVNNQSLLPLPSVNSNYILYIELISFVSVFLALSPRHLYLNSASMV